MVLDYAREAFVRVAASGGAEEWPLGVPAYGVALAGPGEDYVLSGPRGLFRFRPGGDPSLLWAPPGPNVRGEGERRRAWIRRHRPKAVYRSAHPASTCRMHGDCPASREVLNGVTAGPAGLLFCTECDEAGDVTRSGLPRCALWRWSPRDGARVLDGTTIAFGNDLKSRSALACFGWPVLVTWTVNKYLV